MDRKNRCRAWCPAPVLQQFDAIGISALLRDDAEAVPDGVTGTHVAAGLHAGPAGHAAIGAEQAAVFIPLGPAAAAAMDRRRLGRELPLDCHGFSPSFLLICLITIPQITPLAKKEPAIPAPGASARFSTDSFLELILVISSSTHRFKSLPPTKKICAGGLTGEGKLHIISIRLENKLLLRR